MPSPHWEQTNTLRGADFLAAGLMDLPFRGQRGGRLADGRVGGTLLAQSDGWLGFAAGRGPGHAPPARRA